MALGARFQKLRGDLTTRGLNSQRGREEPNSQRGLDSGGLLCFLRMYYFCGNIVKSYSYHWYILISLM